MFGAVAGRPRCRETSTRAAAAFLACLLGCAVAGSGTELAGAAARLASGAGSAVLELGAASARLEVALPDGAKLDSVALTAGGWVAAGTEPAAPAAPAVGGAGRELLLLAGAASPAPRRLPVPSGESGVSRDEPLVLVENGALAGLVWLEGSRRNFAVRYAAWNGGSWAAPQTISPAGAGSQLALSAARLADGSWLVAWSGFDGESDEIVWSLGSRGVWSRPAALTATRVPNITPTVTAAGNGALVAWSQLAGGGYRLLVARFADGAWSEPAEAAAGGALYPSFEASATAQRARLLYRDAARRSWSALDLDATGKVLRRAALAGPAAGTAMDRPALIAGPAADGTAAEGPAVFHWTASGAEQSAAWTPWTGPAAMTGAAPPLAARPKASGPETYIAFGDSITAGYGDSANEGGYPGRLQVLLTQATNSAVTVINDGLFGETTAEGLSRIGPLLEPGANGLLLMEGTNDVSAKVSVSTTVQNLDAMASKAEAKGITAYHATILPRLPTAVTDGTNEASATLAGAIRELAWEKGRGLIDPFEVFYVLTPNWQQLYLGGDDKLHPNADGYTLLAQTFADVLEGIDTVPPVTGTVSPAPGSQNVSPSAEIEVDLFDFGAGIDIANTELLLNDQVVQTTPGGDEHKLEFRYQPPQPLEGVVNLGIETRDLATPPNSFDGGLSQFIITGTTFLPGDLNHDGIVDGLDLLLFAPCFGAHRYSSNFLLICDLNGDGVVNGLDLAILAANFGKSSF